MTHQALLLEIHLIRIQLHKLEARVLRLDQPVPQHPIEAIEKVVCPHFNVVPSELHKPGRQAPVVIARQVCMYFAREHPGGFSLNQIGDFYEGKDHGTVLHGCRTVTDRIETDATFKRKIDIIRTALQPKEAHDIAA